MDKILQRSRCFEEVICHYIASFRYCVFQMVLPLRRRQLRERAAPAETPGQLQPARGLVSRQAVDTFTLGDR